ncbi:MAG: hypothetical protein R6U26_00485 [Candidatus Undinarchaeales archaeon]
MKILKEPRILFFLIILALSIVAIPSFKGDGVVVSYVAPDSPFKNTIETGEIIKSINGIQVESIDNYASALESLKPNEAVSISTNKDVYRALAANSSAYDRGYVGIHVKKPESTNLDLGLELQGGARVTLNPVTVEGVEFNDTVYDTTTEVLMARLNAYALKNVVIRQIEDVNNNKYIIIEMPGEGSEKVVDMVKSVGKFELRILNDTVFTGDAIVPPIGEPKRESETGQWQVQFTIKTSAAEQMRDAFVEKTSETPPSCSADTDCGEEFACSRDAAGGGICLPRIEMFLDGNEMFSAPPAQSLYQTWKYGETSKDLVVETGTQEMAEQVSVVLEAGRLPEQIESLNVISQDYIDPKLGRDFLQGAAVAGGAAILAVGLVVFLRYRKLKIALPIMFTGLSEVLIVLGVASMIHWTIDLPAIAGIITVIGTGVDHQVIITDELLKGGSKESWHLKRSTKTAFGIIMAAVLTTSFAMFPLMYPGFTGLYALRGFAIITIIGVLIGYFVSRPAYAKMAEIILSE